MNFVLVMLGGAVGSALRYGIHLLLVSGDSGFPFNTLVINIVGSFVLGVIGALLPLQLIPRDLGLLLGVGFCGGFTTFSTFSAETLYLLQHNKLWIAVVYATVSVVGGVIATWLGWSVAGRS